MHKTKIFFLVVFLGVAADQLSKALVFEALAGGWNSAALRPVGAQSDFAADDSVPSHPLLPNVLHLTPSRNRGAAFSLLSERPGWVTGFTAFAVVFLTALYWFHGRNTRHAPAVWAYALLLIGATGNLIDRLWFGLVRDFFDFIPELPLIGRWAIFNLADVCICAGAGLYLLNELFWRKPAPAPALSPEKKEGTS